jgi:nicotinic acid phosphoribosyltransferase
MGHEGVMRWGRSEELAFERMADALHGPVIFLIDTTTPEQGMAEAWRVIRNSANPTRFGMRPDSGNLDEQFRLFVEQTQQYGIQPMWIFEDGLRPADVERFEALRVELGYPADRVLYGLGGFLVAPPQFSRDQISLVYKLSHSARFGPVRKRGAEVEAGSSGKGSLPGAPCMALSPEGHPLVYQDGLLPPGYACAELAPNPRDAIYRERPDLDSVTQALIQRT